MAPNEVVIGEVQSNRRFEILSLFAEGMGQTGQPLHVQPRSGVQPFDVACRDEIKIGRPQTLFFSIELIFGALYRRWASTHSSVPHVLMIWL